MPETLASFVVPCKNGIHASEIVELADINMALKTWLGLGDICDLAIKCDHINNRII